MKKENIINMEDLYTSGKARQVLSVSSSTFKTLVDSGKIRKMTPPGKKQGYYVKEDVDKLAKERSPFATIEQSAKRRRASKKENIVTEVDWMKPSDLPAILKLDYIVYQEDIVGDIGLYISWCKKNPKITLLSFDKNNRENVLAYISLVPLPEETILSILKEEKSELSIGPKEVETYERPGGYILLAESAVTHPDHPEQLNHVIRAIFEHWCKQYPTKYIEKIYAQVFSEEGDVLVRKLFFSPLYDLSDKAYVLDLRRRGASRVVRNFQECLKQKESTTRK